MFCLKHHTFLIIFLILTLFNISNKTLGQIEIESEEEYLETAKEYIDLAIEKNSNKLFKKAIKTYKEFLKVYPNSQKAIFAMQQIANLYSGNLRNYTESINTYNELIIKYPDSKEARNAMFMIAFIYDNMLAEKKNAITAYEKFLEKYPYDLSNDEEQYSSNARVMLEKLKSGKSDEEFINDIIEKEDKKPIKKK